MDLFVIALSILALVTSLQAAPSFGTRTARSLNVDKAFVKWPTQKIPVVIDREYSDEEAHTILDAMHEVNENLKQCVEFVEANNLDAPEYKLYITKSSDDNTTDIERCQAYPGMVEATRKAGKKFQRIIIAEMCMQKNLIMKYLAISLGKVNEHNRPDRDEYIRLTKANHYSNTENIYKIKSDADSKYPYDYCSITVSQTSLGPHFHPRTVVKHSDRCVVWLQHNSESAYARPGETAFIVKKEPYNIPRLTRLSETDCKELRSLYSCDPSVCDPLDCSAIDGSVTLIAPPLR